MNSNRVFTLKVDEDKIGPYLVISPTLKRILKLKKGSEATLRMVSSNGKFVFEIMPN